MDSSRLKAVQNRIAAAAQNAGRSPDDVTLVVVSKQRSNDEVLKLYEGGQRLFAENRQQGLRSRIEAGLPDDIVWHFVGPLQTRKVAYVASVAALLHSLDRMSVADRWASNDGAAVLVQFNLAGEPQKSGFDPSDADRTLDDLLGRGLNVRGVMAIPPHEVDAAASARWFSQLRSIFDRYRDTRSDIDVCSMGMSNDFDVAVAEGATMIRVGRAIFEGTDNSFD